MGKTKTKVNADQWNEAKAEDVIKKILEKQGYDIIQDLQLQGDVDEDVKPFLASASKQKDKNGKLKKGRGKPEYVVKLSPSDLLVVEVKDSKSEYHQSKSISFNTPIDLSDLSPAKYAVDGVLHYMKSLKTEFNVIGLGISADSPTEIYVSTFRAKRNGEIEQIDFDTILKKDKYLKLLTGIQGYGITTENELIEFAKSLHEYLRDEMELGVQQKPLLVSGVLLGLMSKSFRDGWRSEDSDKDLAKFLVQSIEKTLDKSGIPDGKSELMVHQYKFIQNSATIAPHLRQVIRMIEKNIPIHTLGEAGATNEIDILGKFYGEFIQYSSGDKKEGIVLTPPHITSLFSKISGVNKNSVVLDTCTGTGGFLIAAMAQMIKDAKGNEEAIDKIKRKGLIGIELSETMFPLACSNMLLRGDGKSNMFHSSCFNKDTQKRVKDLGATHAFLNPPYSKKNSDLHELNFILESANMTKENGLCLAIVPMSCVVDTKKKAPAIRNKILEKHTLEGVISMPDQLFPSVGTVSCIIILRTHQPHPEGYESWFCYLKDDGFVLNKGRREDKNNLWTGIEKKVLESFKNKKEEAGFSVKKAVVGKDEWCAEAYMETDYSKLTKEAFEKIVRNFAIFKASQG